MVISVFIVCCTGYAPSTVIETDKSAVCLTQWLLLQDWRHWLWWEFVVCENCTSDNEYNMKCCVWLVCIVVCFQLLSFPVECARKLANINFLGIGYDALEGNPMSGFEDPGFKQSMFSLEYSKHTETADGRFELPDSVQANQITSCSFDVDSMVVRDVKSYQELLSVSIFCFLLGGKLYILITILGE